MAFFSFLGANQYLKEIEEQERYEEAFNLKQQQLGISKANLELQKENLDLKKAIQEQNLLTSILPLVSGGVSTGSKKTTLGTVLGGAGKSTQGKDNEYYLGAIRKQFPYISDEALASIFANTNNNSQTGKMFYNFLNETKEQYASKGRLIDGQIPQETLQYVVDNAFKSTTNPYKDIKEIAEKLGLKLGESSKGMLDIFTNYSVTNVELPKVTEPLGQMETKDIEFLKKEAFDVASNFYKQEVNALNRSISYFTNKLNTGTITPDETTLLGWMTKRSGELAEIKGFTRENDTNLIRMYGTRDSYQFMRNNPVMNKRVFMPEKPPSMSLDIRPEPVVVLNHKQMITLRDLGILRVGQTIKFQTPFMQNGVLKEIGLVPPKGQK